MKNHKEKEKEGEEEEEERRWEAPERRRR